MAASGELPEAELPTAQQYPEVPYTPTEAPPADILRVFTHTKPEPSRRSPPAFYRRTPDDPGAREAGVTTYIDNFLAVKDGLPEATYP